MSTSLYISIVFSFLATLIILPRLISFLNRIGMTGTDIQKRSRPMVAEMGGPAVLFGFLAGVFVYIWIKT